MSPDDLVTVHRSWADLRLRQDALVERLGAAFATSGPPMIAADRARWLVDAVAELVGLLRAPSQLGARARQLADTWPAPASPPSYRVEGQAWMRAARDVSPVWTARDGHAWRRAWLLLSDVLAEESLSPFAVPVDHGRSART